MSVQTPLPFSETHDHNEQLDEEWRLDAHTREIGRRGLAAARAALAEAARRAEEREAVAA